MPQVKKDEEEEFEALSEDFLQELFKIALSSKSLLSIILRHLKANYLPDDIWRNILTEIKNQFELESKMPTIGTLQLSFRKDREVLILLKEIKAIDAPDVDSVLKSLESYLKQVRFIELYDDCGDLYLKGKRKKALERWILGSESLNKFDLLNEQMEQVFKDFPKRQQDREYKVKSTEKIPFGIDELDEKTQGGAETTEFVLFLGDAKSGKSFLLTHLGVNAARRGFGVAHFQLEGTKKQCLDRYDACWSGIAYHDIKKGDFPTERYQSYQKIVNNLGKNDIWIDAPEKFMSTTMAEIRLKLINLKKDHDIKVVIIDYLDLAMPSSMNGMKILDERQRQQMVAREMKDLAVEQNVLLYSGTQASSISSELLNDPDFVIKREHLSEDKGKVRPVDMLITLNRTIDERKEKIMRLYTEALREYEGGDVITIKQALKYARFYDRKATLSAFELSDDQM